MTHDGRIDPQPVTLDVVPVSMVEDATRREALAAANGRDLVQERVSQVVRFLGVVVLLLAIVRCLVGCAALERAVPAVGVAHDVAKVGCALLSASDGSSADVLAATANMQRAIVEAQADAAKQRGADQATIDALVRSIAVLSEVVRANAEKVVTAAGNGPAVLPVCPAASSP